MISEQDHQGESILVWTKGEASFRAWPTRGARLMSWEQGSRQVIYWPEETKPEQVAKARGGNPVLFPFSARTFHQGLIGQWQLPNGEVREMPSHGITRQGEFEVVEQSDDGFRARLVVDDAAREIYPFDFQFEVEYRFFESGLEVEFILENNDKGAIPWSAGHHFYFQLPWHEGGARSDYRVTIPAENACYQNNDGSLNSTEVGSETCNFGEPALVDRIHYGLSKRKVLIEHSESDDKIEIEFLNPGEIDPEWALVTWTEVDESPFYCVEPWMGPPNSNDTKVGLHWVQPGDVARFSIRIAT